MSALRRAVAGCRSLRHRLARCGGGVEERRAAQEPGGGAEILWGFVAAGDRVDEVDRDGVGEPTADRHLGEFVAGAGHVQGAADAHARLVQQLPPVPGGLDPAGEVVQFGGVAQGDDAARKASVGRRRALVHREEPTAGRVDAVGDLLALGRGQQRRRGGVEPERGHGPLLGVGRQVEQAAGLVVHHDEPVVVADDQHALAHGVEDRVVVLVHPRQLRRPEPARLPLQPTGRPRRARRGQQHRDRRAAQQHRQVRVHQRVHPADGDVDDDRAERLVRGVEDGDGGGDRVEARLVELEGHGLPGEQLGQHVLRDVGGGLVGTADVVRVGGRQLHVGGVEHHDGVDPGGLPDRLCARFQQRGRMRALQLLGQARCAGEGLGDPPGDPAGVAGGAGARLQHHGGHSGDDEQQHDEQFGQEHPSGEGPDREHPAHAARLPLGQRTAVTVRGSPAVTSLHKTSLTCTAVTAQVADRNLPRQASRARDRYGPPGAPASGPSPSTGRCLHATRGRRQWCWPNPGTAGPAREA